MDGVVTAVSRSGEYTFSKPNEESITLLKGLGVEGDAHAGKPVRHRSKMAKDPTQPNLTKMHLIHGELNDALAEQGFEVSPGQMGENVTTRGGGLAESVGWISSSHR